MAKRALSIIDISLPISPRMPIYPGNPSVRMGWRRTPVTYLTELEMGSHTGTHVDAPRHVFFRGKGVDGVPLDALLGTCRVLDLTHCKKTISTNDLKRFRIRRGERILVKTTNSLRGFKKFYPDFVYLDGDAARMLAKIGIVLFGIDSLSVKQKGSLDNRPHTELLKKGIALFEGLDLSRVTPGKYIFLGMPLKLVGRDGAPARVVLVSSLRVFS